MHKPRVTALWPVFATAKVGALYRAWRLPASRPVRLTHSLVTATLAALCGKRNAAELRRRSATQPLSNKITNLGSNRR